MITSYTRHPVQNWIVPPNITLAEALLKFPAIYGKPLLVTRPDGTLFGTLSVGDVLRAISGCPSSLDQHVRLYANKTPVFARIYDSESAIIRLMSDTITSIPLLSDKNEPRAVAVYSSISRFNISSFLLTSESSSVFIVAEIGVNHNGDFDVATSLIDEASSAGANAVKFQLRSDTTYGKAHTGHEDLSAEYVRKQINATYLTPDEECRLFNYAKSKGLITIFTPFDNKALLRGLTYDPDAIKIASCDLTNIPLLKQAASTTLPLIISTGMAYEHEIHEALATVDTLSDNICFLHANSTYPTPRSDLNLRYLQRLHQITGRVVGYSSHDGSVEPSYLALGAGAKVFEVHITHSRDQAGTDHQASLTPIELSSLIKNLHSLSSALGDSTPRIPTNAELLNRRSLGKSLHYARPLPTGHILTEDDLVLASPQSGVSWKCRHTYVGKPLASDVSLLQLLSPSHFVFEDDNPLPFKQTLEPNLLSKLGTWGVPVRFRDFLRAHSTFDSPLYEFHMSSDDLSLDPSHYLAPVNSSFVIHAVEQYSDGFIIDLASPLAHHRDESISRISQLVSLAQMLSKYSADSLVRIVLNCGGFTHSAPLSTSDARYREDILVRSLNLLIAAHTDVVFLPQSMPPFPWLQGGTAYHNIFATYESILRVLDATGLKVCLDISHTFLSANHFGFDPYMAIETLLANDRVGHLHISDAKGTTEEGLMIDDGDFDFNLLCNQMQLYPTSFIPEVWEGHHDNFSGFKRSLYRLNSYIQ